MTKRLLLLNNYERNNLTIGLFKQKSKDGVRFEDRFWNITDEENSREYKKSSKISCRNHTHVLKLSIEYELIFTPFPLTNILPKTENIMNS